MTRRAPSRRSAGGLTVIVTDVRGRTPRGPLPARLANWLAGAAPARARGMVSIALVSDGTMTRLNREFRAKKGPTDVLSFPAPAEPFAVQGGRKLGDLAIATGVARRQARDLGHSVETELKVLALHGLLHLLGYDHEADDGQMARTEERLRRKAGLPSGLIQRHHVPRRAR